MFPLLEAVLEPLLYDIIKGDGRTPFNIPLKRFLFLGKEKSHKVRGQVNTVDVQ